MKKNLFISFSGGETSAFMAQWLITKKIYKNVICLFANTSQENEETLEFVEKCNKHFGLNCVWIEPKVIAGKGNGTQHKIVNFETANRNGGPFEDYIKKYGIPNMAGPLCTKILKVHPMTSYVRSLGWKNKDYDTAIGIRADEIDRMNPNFRKLGFIYPLCNMIPMTKPDINNYWAKMPFRLELKGYQGNCKWCWKKSMRKHLTLIKENESQYDFPALMEKKYGSIGAEQGKIRTFFRKHLSTLDLIKMAKENKFISAKDDSIIYENKPVQLDLSAGCDDSCEIFHDSFDMRGK